PQVGTKGFCATGASALGGDPLQLHELVDEGSAPKAHPPLAEIPFSSTEDSRWFCAVGASASGGDPGQLHRLERKGSAPRAHPPLAELPFSSTRL
ncbi:MAG: hypothetical protein AABZ61_12235, partial [Bacteroidota bacterium]